MAIHGIGTDLVQLHRIEPLWRTYGEKFARRILADSEWDAFLAAHDPISFLAKRFAAKEAVAKALGTGIGAQIAFKEMSIHHTEEGKPEVHLLEKAKLLIKKPYQIHISISDERDLAMAFVVIEYV